LLLYSYNRIQNVLINYSLNSDVKSPQAQSDEESEDTDFTSSEFLATAFT
jgi:hypothetical protein